MKYLSDETTRVSDISSTDFVDRRIEEKDRAQIAICEEK